MPLKFFDINKDGRLDLLVANDTGNVLLYYEQSSDGAFVAKTGDENPFSGDFGTNNNIAIFDLNRDGFIDILTPQNRPEVRYGILNGGKRFYFD